MRVQLSGETVEAFREFAERGESHWRHSLAHTLADTCGCEPDFPSLRTSLSDPKTCFQAILGHYVFARRGKDGRARARAAVSAARLQDRLDPKALWESYLAQCCAFGLHPAERQDEGGVLGLAILAVELDAAHGLSVFDWVGRMARDTERVEPAFLHLVSTPGVGPKFVAHTLRDFAHLGGWEDSVGAVDRLYLQPVDRWVRDVVKPLLSGATEGQGIADWEIARLIPKVSARAKVSGVLANLGISLAGARAVVEGPTTARGFAPTNVQKR